MADRYQGITGIEAPAPDVDLDKKIVDSDTDDGTKKLDSGAEDKYASKTADELRVILKEQETNAGRREQEVGELRKIAQAAREDASRALQETQLRGMSIQQQIAYQQQQAQPKDEIDETKYDFTKPVSSTVKLAREEVHREIDKLRQEQSAQNAVSYRNYSKKNYELGFTRAIAGDPKLFNGIEDDVQNAMYTSWESGKMSAEDLQNEHMWELMARNIHWVRGEDVPSSRRQVVPMQASTGNIPQQVREGNSGSERPGDIQFNEKSYEMLRAFGLSEEEAIKRIKEERSGGGR